jgi:hypothetical protein
MTDDLPAKRGCAVERCWSNRTEFVLSLLIFLGLALPFMPMPGDTRAYAQIRFHNSETQEPRSFAASTTRSVCSVLAVALDYDDPETGNFTTVTCE